MLCLQFNLKMDGPCGSGVGIAISHEKRENGKFVDEKFLTGKSDEKNGKLSSLK